MSNPNEMTDEEIAAAMEAFDLPQPEPPSTPQAATATDGTLAPSAPAEPSHSASPTLDALDESRRPKAKTVCERCPNSVWFASPAELKCYCRVMFLVTWSSKEPNQLTHCDGEFLGQEEG
ncbi:Uncharacterised protein [Enterobacter hormaechei]|uniref:Protein TraH n=3 Tax=root TaxID=1 RepID=TRAH4_ECOLX|nr:RecName: Full=Protein TraH [Escherichia coli]AAU93737.1 TraH [Integration vector pJK202]ADU90757.1 conjugal transfer protein TraH [uncultured bacterium]QCS90213.1 TraH [synthetic construct]UNE55892.1 TraH [Cloning vector pTRANS]WAX25634.1 TraH [Cloning vector pMATING2a]CAA38335.1 traH [Escherichia coli HB101]CAK12732.1 TraH protein [Pseudomonas aeruginosa]SQC99098.1 Uncharacterised protein [Enterobacter hormaechei]BAI47882.1 TraH [Helper vector pRH210]BAI47925.1 TraH [Helper vector pRH